MNATNMNDCRIGEINGPYRQRPSGRFRRDGETPIMVRCSPFWVVDYFHGTIRSSRRFTSRATAQAFWDGLAPFDARMA
jgi:hypothetical protein